MRPWLRAVLKVVVIAATMCNGLIVAKNYGSVREAEHEGGIRQDKRGLERAA